MMQKYASLVVAMTCLSLLLTGRLSAEVDDHTITVAGKDWTVESIKRELAKSLTSISYTGHDGKHTSTAIELEAVLKASGVQTELKPTPKAAPAAKHPEVHAVVVVTGRDGFFTVFSMAELMTELGNRHVWLALDVDQKSWTGADQPMKLVVADDDNKARWVHGVHSISLVNISAPSTQPVK